MDTEIEQIIAQFNGINIHKNYLMVNKNRSVRPRVGWILNAVTSSILDFDTKYTNVDFNVIFSRPTKRSSNSYFGISLETDIWSFDKLYFLCAMCRAIKIRQILMRWLR